MVFEERSVSEDSAEPYTGSNCGRRHILQHLDVEKILRRAALRRGSGPARDIKVGSNEW